jgi:hypothetical protein
MGNICPFCEDGIRAPTPISLSLRTEKMLRACVLCAVLLLAVAVVRPACAQYATSAIRAGAIMLNRSRAEAEPAAYIARVSDDAVLLSTADLDLGIATGFDFELIQRIGANADVAVRYFGVNDWHTSQAANDAGMVRFVGFGASATAEAEQFDYSSRLYNTEVNLRWWIWQGVPALVGFRTLQLHERFADTALAPSAVALDCQTSNYLYGLQIGVEPALFGAGWFRLDTRFKVGAYGNVASENTVFPLVGMDLGKRATHTSFVGEIGVLGGLRFSRHIMFRGGYEMLWITDVALAPDQSRSVNLSDATAAINLSSTAFLHGAVANLEISY